MRLVLIKWGSFGKIKFFVGPGLNASGFWTHRQENARVFDTMEAVQEIRSRFASPNNSKIVDLDNEDFQNQMRYGI